MFLSPQFQQATRQLLPAYQELMTTEPRLALHSDFVFETEQLLGQGGMGRVYEVRDRRLNRRAALKLVLIDQNHGAQAETKARLRRFWREVEITASLSHPSVPPIFEAGVNTEGKPYMLMKVIEGQELGQRIADCHDSEGFELSVGNSDFRGLIENLIKIGEAVSFAHKQGIIHRDIKPSNVMIGAFGEAMLMDWGLAKRSQDSPEDDELLRRSQSIDPPAGVDMTMAGDSLGTPGYMAPEQIDCVQVDERADIYALGGLLCSVLTNERPVEGASTLEIIAATAGHGVIAPRLRNPHAPRELNSIVLKAMHIEPDKRFASAQEFCQELRRYLGRQTVCCHRYSWPHRLIRGIEAHPLRFTMLAAALVLTGFAWSFWTRLKASEARELGAKAMLNVSKKTQRDMSAAYAAIQDAEFELSRGRFEAVADALKTATDAYQSPEIRLECALLYRKAQRLSDARRCLEAMLKDQPRNFRALFELHLVELEESKEPGFRITKSLKRLFLEAEKAGEENEFTLFREGRLLQLQGRHKEALVALNKAVTYRKTFSQAYNAMGASYMELKQSKPALKAFTRAITLDPYNARAFCNRGESYRVLKDFQKAEIDLNRALELSPGLAQLHFTKAHLEYQLERFKSALEGFSQAIALDSEYFAAYQNRGTILQSFGRYAEAESDFLTMIRLQPESAVGYATMCKLYSIQRQFQRALTQINKALELDDSIHGYYYSRAFVYRHLQNPRAALADLSQALKRKPDYAEAYLLKSELHYVLKDLKSSMASLNQAIHYLSQQQRKTYLAQAYSNRGGLHQSQGQMSAALLDFSKALQLLPDLTQAYLNRGHCYRQLRKYTDALLDYQEFLKRQPKSPQAPAIRRLIEELKRQLVK